MATPIEGGEVQGDSEGTPEAPGPNPAWNDVLSVLPEQFHSVVTPHFQQWDQSAQQRIEKANSDLKQFEAYQPFVEHGISPEDLGQGLQLMQQINENPQAVYQALGEAYGLTAGQVQDAIESDGEEEDDEEPQNFQDPRVDQLQQGFDLIAQNLLDQHQQKVDAEAEAELDQNLKALHEKHGDFDEQYVLSLCAVNESMTLDQAFDSYQQLVQSVLQQNPRPFAPNVMGSSGGTGLPSQAIDPRQLDGKGTRDLVARMLQAASES